MFANSSGCELKKGFRRCGATVAGICQYCGRPFCEQHGVFLDEGQEICNRPFCVAKREDVASHLVYKEAVGVRNEAAQCGVDGCGQRLSGRCARCSGYYCERHVGPHAEIIIENETKVERMATLCRHCRERRPIWLRT